MRAIFFGTPQLAVPSLEALADMAEVVRVICQPDRKAGRGMKLRPPPVKVRALELGLPVEQPRKVKTSSFSESLVALRADVAVVVAYGRILPRAVLEAPRRGCVNVHASLLPRWRGAGPIQWAIVRGDTETGVSLMQMDEGMDTGPVIATKATGISSHETAGALGTRLSLLGADLLRETLPAWVDEELSAVPQDDSRATSAPLLTKEDGRIDWTADARAVDALIRGMSPWPGAYTTLDGHTLKVHSARPLPDHPSAMPGEILSANAEGIIVGCGEGALLLEVVQLPGRRRLGATDFLSGYSVEAGARMGGR